MADRTLSAYFLCAGHGSRLLPLTSRIPKPALTFQGKTALEINCGKAQASLGPRLALCNTHHLPGEMEKPALRLGMRVLREAEILGTAGCLHNARDLLETTDRFLVHNGDLIHTIDLADLLRQHADAGPDRIATLAGIFRPAHNTLVCDDNGRLLGVQGYQGFKVAEERRLTFAGIAIYERAFLDFCQPGPEDIKRYWWDALRAGHTIAVADYSLSAAWFDFGTPQGLWDAAKFMMEENREYGYGYPASPAGPAGGGLIRPYRPYVSNEAGQGTLPASLRNVLILEETAKPLPPATSNCIVGRDFWWEISP